MNGHFEVQIVIEDTSTELTIWSKKETCKFPFNEQDIERLYNDIEEWNQL
jgi:hypothetical protein